uniref:Uncharacterized protein n=1 Tax=Globisporangium ultimum (strain ATCC 200006 / CBS 805.95 / DAOM BR144) TaxID=431595 RepID=K3WB27_GLOUD
MSSPARSTSSCLQLGSGSLAVAAYANAPLFVEPSPLSKRMTNRGISNAGGTQSRVSFKKKLPVRIPTQSVVIESSEEAGKQSSSEPAGNNAAMSASTFTSNPSNENDDLFAKISAENCDDSDDAYEDDFVSLDDSELGINDELKLESDTELIDLLHNIPLQDFNDTDIRSKIHGTAAPNEPLPEHETECVREIEISAATCIQRHLTGGGKIEESVAQMPNSFLNQICSPVN